jgi:hypothetical protein
MEEVNEAVEGAKPTITVNKFENNHRQKRNTNKKSLRRTIAVGPTVCHSHSERITVFDQRGLGGLDVMYPTGSRGGYCTRRSA